MILPILAAYLLYDASQGASRAVASVAKEPAYRVGGPLVSVIIPAYNEEKRLPATLSAIANQTYSSIEVVVVDNESTDSTREIASSFGAKVITASDYNLSKSRNLGVLASYSDILCFLDADTIMESTVIEKTVEAMQQGAVLVETRRSSYDYLPHGLALSTLTLFGNEMSGSTQYIATTRAAFNAIRGFDETKLPQENQSEEKDFIARMIAAFPKQTAILRGTWIATSSRRIKAQGIVADNIFVYRAIRGIESADSEHGNRQVVFHA